MDKRWECLDGRSVETDWEDYKYEAVLVGILGVSDRSLLYIVLSCGFVKVTIFGEHYTPLFPASASRYHTYTTLPLVLETTSTPP
jgi:hypothetical protein